MVRDRYRNAPIMEREMQDRNRPDHGEAHKEKSKEDLWIFTYTGQKVHPFDLKPDQVRIADIAHALSRTCRYSGHVEGYYSVAEHCLLISDLVSEEHEMCALLHDAPEAYLTDLPSPVKSKLSGYNELEEKVWSVIAKKYGVPQQIPKEVKHFDESIVRAELRDVKNLPEDFFDIQKDTPDVEIEQLSIDQAKYKFIEKYLSLKGE